MCITQGAITGLFFLAFWGVIAFSHTFTQYLCKTKEKKNNGKNVVPMCGLEWRCKFTPLKEDCLLRNMLTEVASLIPSTI